MMNVYTVIFGFMIVVTTAILAILGKSISFNFDKGSISLSWKKRDF